jgi:hypothetical protein
MALVTTLLHMDGCGNSKKHESEMLELPLKKVVIGKLLSYM